MNPRTAEWLGLAAFLALCFLAAGVGSWFTTPEIDSWYRHLAKPAWTPPSWLFGPVWTLLYIAMAVAAWLVWRQHGWSGARLALGLFAGQLVLNVAWSGLFFAMHNPGAALLELVALWLAILATAAAFWQKQPVAGLLMIPYAAWVAFAGTLNLAVWQLNR